jgi:hypothetical protein
METPLGWTELIASMNPPRGAKGKVRSSDKVDGYDE